MGWAWLKFWRRRRRRVTVRDHSTYGVSIHVSRKSKTRKGEPLLPKLDALGDTPGNPDGTKEAAEYLQRELNLTLIGLDVEVTAVVRVRGDE